MLLCLAAIKVKIPTEDALKRRNFNGPSWCSICLEEEEIVAFSLFIVIGHHLFGIYHFPGWVLAGCNPLLSKCGGGLEKNESNWVSGHGM